MWKFLSQQSCVMASDGSAPHGKGSFAWYISTWEGTRIAKCYGPVFGHRISSYRSECYGILSLLCFLYNMSTLHSANNALSNNRHHQLYCDNESLVTVITKAMKYPTIYPNMTITSDWDCIAQVLSIHRGLDKLTPTIAHIKGHQDADTPYEQLPLSAQLNCDADALATRYLQEHPDINHSIAHMFPEAHCLLHIQNNTITRDIKEALSTASNLPAYKEYVSKTSKWWDSEVFDNIDWLAHHRAMARHRQHYTTLVKYVHKLLPLGHPTHLYDEKYPPHCPSCCAPKEDIKHFWKCPSPSRLQWRRDFLRNLDKKLMDLGTGQSIRELLVMKLRAVLDGLNPDRIPVDLSLTHLNNEQGEIGWEQILRGRFALGWSSHPHTLPSTTKTGKESWTTNIIDFILEQWWSLWEMRTWIDTGET